MIPTVLVTGGSRGIGAAAVRKFAAAGWNVGFTYRSSAEKAQTLAAQLNAARPCCASFRCDVADRFQVMDTCAQTLSRFGRIDALVNNAGAGSTQLFQDAQPEEISRIFAVNVYGTLYAAQAVLPEMISRRSGAIVNVSSVWGLAGASCEVVYSAAKAAVIGFTKALAKEVGPSGVRVNCVAPGAVRTDMLACYSEEDLADLAADLPLERLGSAEEIADAILYLASAQSSYLTGQVLSPNGGLVV